MLFLVSMPLSINTPSQNKKKNSLLETLKLLLVQTQTLKLKSCYNGSYEIKEPSSHWFGVVKMLKIQCPPRRPIKRNDIFLLVNHNDWPW
jgi:hypothetical protein